MKSGRIFLSLAIGTLIFSGIIISENARLGLLADLEDPFTSAVQLENIIVLDKGSSPRDILSSEGEFFRISPGTNLDFTASSRELKKGELFFSTAFTATKGIPDTFNLQYPKIGQIKAGPVLISTDSSSAFVQLLPDKESLNIYASDHAAQIFVKSGTEGFTLPAGMKISIPLDSFDQDSLFSYSQLKKKWQMEPFVLVFPPYEQGVKAEDKIGTALFLQGKLREKFKNFAKLSPPSWSRFNSGSIVGKIVQGFHNNAMFLSKQKKDNFAFQSLVSPLIIANSLADSDDYNGAKKEIAKFKSNTKLPKWKKVMENQKIARIWGDFIRSQRVWIETLPPSAPEQVFASLLDGGDVLSDFQKVQKEFAAVETLISNMHFKSAITAMIQAAKRIDSLHININNQQNLTKIRRVWGAVLQANKFFRTKEGFEAYAILIQKENMLSWEDKTLKKEITVDAGRDLLAFLKLYTKDSPDQLLAQMLLDVYKSIGMNTLVADASGLFSQDEIDIMKFINVAGASGLTPEEIESVQKQKAHQEALNKKIAALKKTKQRETDSTDKGGLVENAKDLENFLSSLGIAVGNLKISELKAGEYFRFVDGSYMGNQISGNFQVSTQLFKTMRVGEMAEYRIPRNKIKQTLFALKQKESNAKASAPKEKAAGIAQNTKEAILERIYIREVFLSDGFEISRENIEILDETFESFSLTEAKFGRDITANFVYNKTDDVVNKVELKGQRAPQIRSTLKRTDFIVMLKKIVESKER